MSEQINGESLSDVRCGHKCVVKRISGNRAMAKRLIEMGVGSNSIVEVERVAPLGDPVEIKVKGCHLSIRLEEARHIEITKCEK